MQTNPAVEQSKIVRWSESPWNQSGMLSAEILSSESHYAQSTNIWDYLIEKIQFRTGKNADTVQHVYQISLCFWRRFVSGQFVGVAVRTRVLFAVAVRIVIVFLIDDVVVLVDRMNSKTTVRRMLLTSMTKVLVIVVKHRWAFLLYRLSDCISFHGIIAMDDCDSESPSYVTVMKTLPLTYSGSTVFKAGLDLSPKKQIKSIIKTWKHTQTTSSK